jgi:hypothetical protein
VLGSASKRGAPATGKPGVYFTLFKIEERRA